MTFFLKYWPKVGAAITGTLIIGAALFLLAVIGHVSLIPVTFVSSLPMAKVLTLLIAGAIVYLFFIVFEKVFMAIGCGGDLVALVGFPISILGLGYLAPGFLFTFTAHWLWQVLWSILIASAVHYSAAMWRPKVKIVITRTQTFQKK